MELWNKKCWIDLHLHLDGSLSLNSVRNLAKLQEIAIPEKDEELRRMLVCPEDCQSLNDYLKCFDFPLTLLQTEEAIAASIKTLMEELLAEGVIYGEIRFAPQLHCRNGLSQRQVIASAIQGLKVANIEMGAEITCNLILCCMRGQGNEKANEETVALAKEYLGKGVVAVDLAGAEALYPTSDYAQLFALAGKLAVPFTIHAGEAAGADSVQLAVSYGAKRIGHGVRAYENPALLQELKDAQVLLELCPTSNLQTKVLSRLEDYPLMDYYKMGIPVSVNTDNRTVSDTTVKDEWKKLQKALEISEEDIFSILLTTIKNSFASEEAKERIRHIILKERDS